MSKVIIVKKHPNDVLGYPIAVGKIKKTDSIFDFVKLEPIFRIDGMTSDVIHLRNFFASGFVATNNQRIKPRLRNHRRFLNSADGVCQTYLIFFAVF